jgi:nicotinamidase-related amidase
MQQRRLVPPLVFIDLHGDQMAETIKRRAKYFVRALENCRLLLEHARSRRWQLAFVTPLHSKGRRRRGTPLWVPGFEPSRNDMVFDRNDESCYSSREFADAIGDAGNAFVLAGFSTEKACLLTMIDASRNGHRVGFVIDASATRPLPGYSAEESHRAVIALASRYATLTTARRWIEVAGTIRSDLEPHYENSQQC